MNNNVNISFWIGKPSHFNVFGIKKPNDLNRIAKIDYAHICLRDENLSFNNNYITQEN